MRLLLSLIKDGSEENAVQEEFGRALQANPFVLARLLGEGLRPTLVPRTIFRETTRQIVILSSRVFSERS